MTDISESSSKIADITGLIEGIAFPDEHSGVERRG